MCIRDRCCSWALPRARAFFPPSISGPRTGSSSAARWAPPYFLSLIHIYLPACPRPRRENLSLQTHGKGRDNPMDTSKDVEKYYRLERVSSANECTGLMPAATESAEEARSEAGLMDIHCPPAAQPPASGPEAHAAARPSDGHNPPRRRRCDRHPTPGSQTQPRPGQNP